MDSMIYVDTYLVDAGVNNRRAVGNHFGKRGKILENKKCHIEPTKFDASTVGHKGL
jgi:hypothetical protein